MNGPPPDSPATWLSSAKSALAAARALVDAEGVLPEVPAYHAQQAVEKALKALLISLVVPFPRTHVIRALLDLITSTGRNVPEPVDAAFRLTQFASLTRYPGVMEPVTNQEAQESIDLAETVLTWAEGLLAQL